MKDDCGRLKAEGKSMPSREIYPAIEEMLERSVAWALEHLDLLPEDLRVKLSGMAAEVSDGG